MAPVIKKSVDELVNINLANCVLVNFPNDIDKSTAIGYSNWLELDNDEEIEKAISLNSVVTIYWPKDTNVTSAVRSLKKSLTKKNFDIEPAVILHKGSKYKTIIKKSLVKL